MRATTRACSGREACDETADRRLARQSRAGASRSPSDSTVLAEDGVIRRRQIQRERDRDSVLERVVHRTAPYHPLEHLHSVWQQIPGHAYRDREVADAVRIRDVARRHLDAHAFVRQPATHAELVDVERDTT